MKSLEWKKKYQKLKLLIYSLKGNSRKFKYILSLPLLIWRDNQDQEVRSLSLFQKTKKRSQKNQKWFKKIVF